MQRCYQTSYASIVARRGSSEFETPCGLVVSDFVPFYFSPITAMASAIDAGKVSLRNPNGEVIDTAVSENIVFLVSNTKYFENTKHPIYFTNVACNSKAEIPDFERELSKIDTHINWSLFDESPYKAKIPEIGYGGVCRYFFDRDDGVHGNRSAHRMAEFMVKDEVPLDYIECIVVGSEKIKAIIEKQIDVSHWDIPVLKKPDCYF
jgi:hypothetical protein